MNRGLRGLWIILAVLVVGIGVPVAQADSFTTTVTCSDPDPTVICETNNLSPTTANFPGPFSVSFSYERFDSAHNLLASYFLAGFVEAQNQPGDVYQYGIDLTTGVSAFSDFTQTGTDLFANNFCQSGACGTVTFVPVATPEPSSLLLLGGGLASLVVLRRKRTS